jgi:hypothetical protein
MAAMRIISFALVAIALISCAETGKEDFSGTTVQMDFTRSRGFYTAPFPSDDLQNADGSIRIAGYPNPDKIKFVVSTLKVIQDDVKGFGLSSGVFMTLSGEPDRARLPDIFSSIEADSPVFLMGVGAGAMDFGKRYPVDVSFAADGGPFGAPNLLSMLPLQGVPLLPKSTYAAVVLRSLRDNHGKRLGVSTAMQSLADGKRPKDLDAATFAKYKDALAALQANGVNPHGIAGLAVFTTGDPAAQMGVFRDAVLALPRPQPETAFALQNTFANFCVYHSTFQMPVYQDGTPPFDSTGGKWVVDADGKPVLHGTERANVFVTVPRKPMPADGYPAVVVIRTGGDPLINRGVHPVAHEPSVTEGTGPAWEFAKEGFAGITVDGPHGGLRNVSKGDEQLLMFNFLNPPAMRDNVRQTALETILIGNMMQDLSFDTSDCAGSASTVHFDGNKLALMGHSMGATVAQPTLAFEPKFKAVILSGSGSSWIENLVHKKKPLDVKKTAEILLTYGKYSRHLDEYDPVVSLAQWAGDPSDGPAYNRLVKDRHILMLQGIVDHYILPSIANTTSLTLGLDLGGTPLDGTVDEIKSFRTLESLFPFYGGKQVKYPVSLNHGKGTAVVVQYPEDGIEDGHEVAFQTEAPKRQYRCFLRTFAAAGTPVVDDPKSPTCAGLGGY